MESTPHGASNAGIVVGSRALLFIDTRITPRLGRNLREIGDSLARAEGAADRLVALTHAHGDHCFGGGELTPATFIATGPTRDALRDRWSQQLAHLEELRPAQAAEFSAAQRVWPQVLVDDAITLDLGDIEVELRAVGPAHTPGDLAAVVDADDVAFVGDVAFNGHWPMLFEADFERWLGVLDGDTLRRGTIVPGHGGVGGPEVLDRMADCLRLLARAARDRHPPAVPAPFDRWLHFDRFEVAVERLRTAQRSRAAPGPAESER